MSQVYFVFVFFPVHGLSLGRKSHVDGSRRTIHVRALTKLVHNWIEVKGNIFDANQP